MSAQKPKPKSGQSSSVGTAGSSERGRGAPFTPRQQDAQARNAATMDPYGSSDSSDEGPGGRRGDAYGQDSHHQIQLRLEAAVILDSPELLMMHAQARNDSIPGTRYHFTKRLCGYEDEESDAAPVSGSSSASKAREAKAKSLKGSRWEKPA